MNIRTILLAGLAACFLGASSVRAQGTIETMPPVVVKTTPQAGTSDVKAGTTELKVTFSKPMTDGSWSWSTAWKDSMPEIVGQPRYESDGKTCVLTVKLEPNKTYAIWLNSEKFKNFKDKSGRPAVPYLLAFKTQ